MVDVHFCKTTLTMIFHCSCDWPQNGPRRSLTILSSFAVPSSVREVLDAHASLLGRLPEASWTLPSRWAVWSLKFHLPELILQLAKSNQRNVCIPCLSTDSTPDWDSEEYVNYLPFRATDELVVVAKDYMTLRKVRATLENIWVINMLELPERSFAIVASFVGSWSHAETYAEAWFVLGASRMLNALLNMLVGMPFMQTGKVVQYLRKTGGNFMTISGKTSSASLTRVGMAKLTQKSWWKVPLAKKMSSVIDHRLADASFSRLSASRYDLCTTKGKAWPLSPRSICCKHLNPRKLAQITKETDRAWINGRLGRRLRYHLYVDAGKSSDIGVQPSSELWGDGDSLVQSIAIQ